MNQLEKVRQDRAVADPPATVVRNILAMEAPIGGSGRYRTAQIVEALTTVYSGFLAAIEGVSHGAKRPGRSTGAIDVVVIYSSPVW